MLILILVFLSMVHEYAYFLMDTFGNRSVLSNCRPCSLYSHVVYAVSSVNCIVGTALSELITGLKLARRPTLPVRSDTVHG